MAGALTLKVTSKVPVPALAIEQSPSPLRAILFNELPDENFEIGVTEPPEALHRTCISFKMASEAPFETDTDVRSIVTRAPDELLVVTFQRVFFCPVASSVALSMLIGMAAFSTDAPDEDTSAAFFGTVTFTLA